MSSPTNKLYMRPLLASRLTALLVVFMMCSICTFAQTKKITGRVTDQDGKGIPGVTIAVKGTSAAVQTSDDGSYSIEASPRAVLVFSSVGFTTQEINLEGREAVSTILASQNANLSEVVVIGYGTARRKDLTGAVASVSSKDFNRGAVTTPSQLIQGKVAGVLVVNNSGQPGAATTVRIRGNTSIRTGNQPLYVIDGVPIDSRIARPALDLERGLGQSPPSDALYYINPFDIASMDVLKDASATAIYGSRGSNGVIMITTKKGVNGPPRIDVNASAGLSGVLKKYDVLDANEYRAALKQYNITTGDFGGSADAFDAITRTGLTQIYNVAANGGNEAGRYRAAFGYYNQEGVILKSRLKKYTAAINGQYKFLESKRLSLDFNLMTSHNEEEIPPVTTNAGFRGNLIGQALQWNPTRPLRKAGDSLDRPGGDLINPLAMSEDFDDNTRLTSIFANASVGFKILDNLEYRFLYGLNHQTGIRVAQISSLSSVEGVLGRGVAFYGENELSTQVLTHTLNYNTDLSTNLSLNALAGYEFQKFNFSGSAISGQDFTTDIVNYTDILQNASQTSLRTTSFADPITELQSFFGRAILNLKDKYLLTATLRADGSSKFGSNNRYGYFPSFAAAWNLSNEDFMKGSSMFSQLKLRAGWGITGNQEFPAGSAQAQYTFGQGSIALSNVANPDLKWESTKQFNIGVDFTMFSNKLFGTLDYFNKNTEDLLFNFSTTQPAPASRYWVNLPGHLTNSGVEISLNSPLIKSSTWNWDLTVNASFLHNELKDYNGPVVLTGTLSGQGSTGALVQRLESGQPLNAFYVRKFEGLDNKGNSIYTDNGNSFFFVGDPNPKTLLGISTNVAYKNFTLTLNGNGAFGHDIYNETLNNVIPIGNLGTRNIASELIGNTIQESLANPITPSSRYVTSGNFFKLNNATLSYRLGNMHVIKNASIYLTGQNLFVITNYKGFDPEVNTDKSVEGVPSFGIEYIPYPSARTVLLGINFSL